MPLTALFPIILKCGLSYFDDLIERIDKSNGKAMFLGNQDGSMFTG
jgi:hypothetical protein